MKYFCITLNFGHCYDYVHLKKETKKILSHVLIVNVILLLIQSKCIVQISSASKATPVQILLITPEPVHLRYPYMIST